MLPAGALFLAYALASLLWSSGDVLWAATELASFVAAWYIGFRWQCLRTVAIWFCGFMVLNIFVALALDSVPYALYGNANYLGSAIAIALACAILYDLWVFYPFAAIGLLWCGSRGALFASAIAVLFGLAPKHRALALSGLAILAAIALTTSLGRPLDSFASRLGIWQDTVNHLSLFGSGWGSFFDTYASWPIHTNMTLQRPAHAYNDFLETIFDLGLGAIPLWLMLILAMEEGSERLILGTFFALALTFFPLHILPVGQLFALALGQSASRRVFHSRSLECIA